jgi:hypothetical protein
MKLEAFLQLAGITQLAILSASALVPIVCRWREELAALSSFLRALFWVYGAFIVLTIAALGTLTLRHAQAMAAGEPVARSLATFVALFWGLRLLVQIFVFDPRRYLTTVRLRLGYHGLTAAFAFVTAVCAWAAIRPSWP